MHRVALTSSWHAAVHEFIERSIHSSFTSTHAWDYWFTFDLSMISWCPSRRKSKRWEEPVVWSMMNHKHLMKGLVFISYSIKCVYHLVFSFVSGSTLHVECVCVSPAGGEWGRGDKRGRWGRRTQLRSHVCWEAAALVESTSENWGKKCEETKSIFKAWIKEMSHKAKLYLNSIQF